MARKDIFDALKADHDRHRAALKALKTCKPAARAETFEAFRVEVTAHAAAEEMSLYAAMLARSDLREAGQHSVAEHKEIEDMLEELSAVDPKSEVWDKKFAKLKERYEHHIDEEEDEMFPEAAEGLSDREEQRLLDVFRKEKPAEAKKAAQDLG